MDQGNSSVTKFSEIRKKKLKASIKISRRLSSWKKEIFFMFCEIRTHKQQKCQQAKEVVLPFDLVLETLKVLL